MGINKVKLICLASIFLFISGCVTTTLETARLHSTDLTFREVGGSNVVSPGGSFQLPKEAPWCYDNTTDSIGSIFKPNTPIAAQSNVGVKHGGKIYQIDVAGETEPLFGLLLFCHQVSSLAELADVKKYASIIIPEKFRNIARSGRITSVYEVNQVTPGFFGSQTKSFSWVLWLTNDVEKLG